MSVLGFGDTSVGPGRELKVFTWSLSAYGWKFVVVCTKGARFRPRSLGGWVSAA